MQSYLINPETSPQLDPSKLININIGILGHVDSGKTSLVRRLSQTTSTAALDKNPQSQERGITLDLGFSCFLTTSADKQQTYQYTLVDCPGHASLIRTIICGASIIDYMFLVIDVQKGIQTQTAECLVIAELLVDTLFVVLNKVDLIEESEREKVLEKKIGQLKKVLEKTKFAKNLVFLPVSASQGIGIDLLVENLVEKTQVPQRDDNGKFVLLIDHCFSLKGKGTVVTGTVVQGKVKPGDAVEFSNVGEKKTVKSIQMFKKDVKQARKGDRVGMLIKGLESSQIERGIAYTPQSLTQISRCIININKIKFFKQNINNKQKFHISCNNQTVMGQLYLFSDQKTLPVQDTVNLSHMNQNNFDFSKEYQYLEQIEANDQQYWAILELEKPIVAQKGSLIIASKFDTDITANVCRIAFHGFIFETETKNLQVSRMKCRKGVIDRIIDEYTIIVKDLFKQETNPEIFLQQKVEIEGTGNVGVIGSTFGKSGKVKCNFGTSVYLDSNGDLVEGVESKEIEFKFKKFYYKAQK